MEQYFYIICIVSFVIVFGLAYYLINNLYQERALYRMFTENGDMRALLAKDPKRFHISMIYLMTYMTRSDSDRVQKDKLKMILRYITEVCPLEYHKDAIKALKFLTDRYKKSGKSTYHESLIDVDAFLDGKENCINKGDNSYKYTHDLHGKRLAEELGRYMSDDDKLYVMYLLFRLAIADGVITDTGRKSELAMMNRLCVAGLKIDKSKLDDLINEFAHGDVDKWYNQHFENRDDRYPSADLLANIFRVDINTLASLDKKISRTSYLGPTQNVLIASGIILGILLFIFMAYEDDLMGNVYPQWIFWVGLVATGFVLIMSACITKLESAVVPILRTDIENELQRKGLIISVILILIVVFTLLWGTSNTLYLVGNKMFCGEKVIKKTVPVKRTYKVTRRTKNGTRTDYYVVFESVSFADKGPITDIRKSTSPQNSFCLSSLTWLSGMKLIGVANSKEIHKIECNSYTYSIAEGKNIKLSFKVGYYGLLYFDEYEITTGPTGEEIYE